MFLISNNLFSIKCLFTILKHSFMTFFNNGETLTYLLFSHIQKLIDTFYVSIRSKKSKGIIIVQHCWPWLPAIRSHTANHLLFKKENNFCTTFLVICQPTDLLGRELDSIFIIKVYTVWNFWTIAKILLN